MMSSTTDSKEQEADASSNLRTFIHSATLLPILDNFSLQPDDAKLDQLKSLVCDIRYSLACNFT